MASANMDSVYAQRWSLLAGCVISTVNILYILWTYVHDRRLHRRPGSLLVWRALHNLGWCLVIILNEVKYGVEGFPRKECFEQECPRECVSGSADWCRASAFLLQVFALCGESYYFVISVDLFLNLRSSPFSHTKTRVKFYHIFVLSTGLVMAIFLANGNWGPSTVLLRHVCWNKNFGVTSATEGLASGWTFMYTWTTVYYISGIGIISYTAFALRRGIPRTLEVRRRRIDDGKRMVAVFTVYLLLQIVYFNVVIRVADQDTGGAVMKAILAFWLGSRGIPDGIVWRMVVIRNVSAGPGALETQAADFVIERSTSFVRAAIDILAPSSSSSSTSSPVEAGRAAEAGHEQLRENLLSMASSSAAEVTERPMVQDPAMKEEAMELNKALQDEVLFFTLLGLRTSAAKACMIGEGNEASNEVDLVAAVEGAETQEGWELEEMENLRASLTRMKFKFVAYSNLVYARVRSSFAIPNAEYIHSLRGYKNERFDGGASGAIMFFSADQRYIVKQMARSEAKKLQEIISAYSEHMARFPNSLLCRIVHACSVVMYGTTLDFMVLENCFWNASADISEIYDLKGSWVDRNAAPTLRGSWMRCRLCNQKYVVGGPATCPVTANKVHLPSVTFKDQDLTDKIVLPRDRLDLFKRTLDDDTLFLAERSIMDYSLLLGIKQRLYPVNELHPQPAPGGGGAASNPVFREDEGGINACLVVGPGTYYIGVIDLLQVWNFKKQMESAFKSCCLCKDKKGISAVAPDYYRERFLDNLKTITAEPSDFVSIRNSLRNSDARLPSLEENASLRQSPRAGSNPRGAE